MDQHTLELLEFNKIRELVAGYAACSLGKELARQIEPQTELERVRAEQSLVSEMAAAISEGHSPPFGGLHDIRLLTRRAAIGSMLTADQLLEVADVLTCTGNIYRYRMRLGANHQRLLELLAPVEDMGPAAKSITGCIDPRGNVQDMASPELGKIRRLLAEIDEKVQAQIRRLLRDPELRTSLRYANATVSGDHYVLPVAVNHRHKVPGVVHRTSSSGETVFIEPAAVANLSAERTVLKGDEDREIKKILRRLSAEVGRYAKPLGYALTAMARLDLITAKARFSRAYNMYQPDMNSEGRLWLRQARHPLLEYLFRNVSMVSGQWSVASGQESMATDHGPRTTDQEQRTTDQEPRTVVPIDVRLGSGFNLLIITGPNTGGKTVALKTTGLLALMAQSGLHIPAGEGSLLPVFSNILADIGDEQSLEQSLSTFSSHISRIAAILETADDKSLVLLDELGAGTDPTEGAALGRAILDDLDRIGCRAMVTTHLGDLKTYAFTNDRAENAAVEFDVESLRPMYKLHIGQFGQSCALKIARRLNLPRPLLKRAYEYVRGKSGKTPELHRLQEMREAAEKAREEAMQAQHEAEKQRDQYERELAKAQNEAKQAAVLREFRSRLQPNDEVFVPQFDKRGKVVRVDHKRNIVVVSVGLGQWEVSSEEVLPATD